MATDGERPNLDEMRAALREPLQAALNGARGEYLVEYLCEPKNVADDPAKLLITDGAGHKLAIVLVAAPLDPDIVSRGMRIAAEARNLLGERLGGVILEPLGEGALGGLSYSILPFRKPIDEGRIARRYWRLVLRGKVLDWLAEVSEITATAAVGADTSVAFAQPLEHLASLEILDSTVRDAAGEALRRLAAEEWKPLTVLMHGDLWEGNLLLASRSSGRGNGRRAAPFVLIDWPGANLRGYPLYDLLRIARSMKLGRSGLEREVARHCEILDFGPAGAMGHLLASLGHLGLNLGCFPPETFAGLSLTCFNDLRNALSMGTE